MTEQKSRSPYVRHNKAPYLYSEPLRAWHASAKKQDESGMREHHAAWLRHMERMRRGLDRERRAALAVAAK